jgi:hypothetical protein
MDLEELKRDKKELAELIQAKINEFMEKYYVNIKSIDLIDTSNYVKYTKIVNMEVEL